MEDIIRDTIQFSYASQKSITFDGLVNLPIPTFLFPSQCLITGDSFRPDRILYKHSNKIHILELTVGFESDLEINSDR